MDEPALHELTAALYTELHQIAARHLRNERREHTLQPTALLHEAYVKLSADGRRRFTDRTHFLALASRVMRQVLIDHARARATVKRSAQTAAGGELQLAQSSRSQPLSVLSVQRALELLAQEDAALAKLVELHYFGGLTAREIAVVLHRSIHVVRHDLRFAQAWLRRQLSR